MINSKYIKLYLLGLVTTVTLGVTYAYSSISNSLNYLRNEAGDTGHIGYIITNMFGTDDKIDREYLDLPSGLVINDATTSVTGIVMLEANTGATASTTKAATSNIVYQVWNNLNTRINSIVSTALTTETDPVWNTASGSYYTKTQTDTNLNLKENLSNKSTLTTLGTSNTLYPTQNAVKSYVDTGLGLKASIASPTLTGSPKSSEVLNANDNDSSLATTAFVQNRVSAVSATSGITFSNCSTTDKKQMFYECDPTLPACSTVGAYCGGGKVAGSIKGSLIVSALSDEGQNTWGYSYMNPATQMCWEKGSFGFDDWQLPNKEELNLLYTNKTIIGGFDDTNTYWSSTEYSDSSLAWFQNFSNGNQYYSNKNTYTYYIRCIRKY